MTSPRVILIVDDDPADAYFLRQALEETCPGAHVLDVDDGQDAMDYLAGLGRFSDRGKFPAPTHVFLDVKMPRRSGLEVLEWIRGVPELRALPVVVLSGSQLSGDMEQARALGAEYLVKPVDYPSLRRLVEDFCRRMGP